MEKADRDYTQAKRAEEEYRLMIQQYPDSKLVPEAKARLLEVQEVLADREFRIGHFYYTRESYPAAIARLKSMVDAYPLYSNADEALWLLGQSYEREKELIDRAQATEAAKARMGKDFIDRAADAYTQIVEKYPLEERAADAKERLKALFRTVPTPTAEAIAFNKQVRDSRTEMSRYQKMKSVLRHGPDTNLASKVGDPTMEDPKQTSAPDIVKSMMASATTAVTETTKPSDAKSTTNPTSKGTGGSTAAGAEVISNGLKPGEEQAPPHSDQTTAPAPILRPDPTLPQTALPPPSQVNDANTPDPNAPTATTDKDKDKDKDSTNKPKDSDSTSKKKKKGFFRKLIPIGG